MYIVTIFISVLITVNAVSDNEQWISFKSEHSKLYKSSREESVRFRIFQDNLRKIEVHNAKYEAGEETYMMGVNQFTDLTQEEFEKMWSMPNFEPGQPEFIYSAKSYPKAAKSVDWRQKGAVTEVRDQGGCGCCWAFSSVGALEGHYAHKHKKLISLSPQELVDCSGSYGTGGCNGGWMHDAFRYVKDHAIASLDNYKYHAKDESCKNSTTSRVPIKLSGYAFVDKNEEAIRQAIEHIGPLSISMNHRGLGLYSKGILNPKNCAADTTHAVLIVGYGTENGVDYWIVKNSWGKSWGENGYFRIIRNGSNPCGIYNLAVYPVVV